MEVLTWKLVGVLGRKKGREEGIPELLTLSSGYSQSKPHLIMTFDSPRAPAKCFTLSEMMEDKWKCHDLCPCLAFSSLRFVWERGLQKCRHYINDPLCYPSFCFYFPSSHFLFLNEAGWGFSKPTLLRLLGQP